MSLASGWALLVAAVTAPLAWGAGTWRRRLRVLWLMPAAALLLAAALALAPPASCGESDASLSAEPPAASGAPRVPRPRG